VGSVVRPKLRLVGIVLLLVAAAVSCARLPSDPSVKAFGQGVEAAADVFNRTVDVHLELARRLGDEQSALDYIDSDSKPDYSFPPSDFAKIKKEALLPHRQLIEAIGGYGKALAEASDKGTIDQLEASAISLATAAGTAVAPLIGGAAVPLVSPAVRLAGRGIGLAVANAYATEIYAVIRRMDPVIRKAADELAFAIQTVERNNRDKLEAWRGAKRANLDTIRSDSKVTRSEAYADFRAAVAEARAIETKIDALKQYKRLLDSMVAAHHALTSVETDADVALVRFIEISKDVGSLIAATSTAK
jgi:hypothetical protein